MADPQAQAIASALAQIESTVQNVQRIQMTVADAQSLAHKIDTQLQTGGHDAVGDMSPEQLYDFMVSAATANTNVTLPAQSDAVREINENNDQEDRERPD